MSDRNRRTIILMSRGMRLARFFKEAAIDLAKDFRVVVFLDKSEYKFWSDIKETNIEVRHFDTLIDKELNNNKVELEAKVKEIEHEINLPFFKSGANYFLYRKFVKREGSRWPFYVIDDKQSMMRDYVGTYLILKKIFTEAPPALIFYEALDLVSCRVAYAFAYKKGIFALGVKLVPHIPGKIKLIFGFEQKNILMEYYYKNKNMILKNSYIEARIFIDKIKGGFEIPHTVTSFMQRMKYPGGLISKVLFVISQMPKMAIGFFIFRPVKFIKYTFGVLWLSKRCHFDLPKNPYIAFFLHHQPEITTCGQIPRWVNQEAIIEQLAINAPLGIDILVKEHPRTFGMRGAQYFREIIAIPNIFLCHPLLDSYRIIKNSKIIFTLTGTAGLEGIIMGKKVAVLGRPDYSVYKGVKKLDYPEEIFNALNDSSWKPEDMEEERLDFVAAYLQSLYDFCISKKGKLWPEIGGDKWADAIRDFLIKEKEYGLTPNMFDDDEY